MTKRYQSKKTSTKTQGPELESETDCKGRYTNLGGYIFYLGPRYLEKFARKMKEMEWYIGETYSGSCKPYIMTKTLETFPNPEMPTIIPDTGTKRPNMDRKIVGISGLGKFNDVLFIVYD